MADPTKQPPLVLEGEVIAYGKTQMRLEYRHEGIREFLDVPFQPGAKIGHRYLVSISPVEETQE